MNFKQLCALLALEEGLNRANKKSALINWCQQHISSDLHFIGSDIEIYDQYYQLALNYVDNFLPHALDEFEAPQPPLDNLSPIHYAARQGYNIYLASQEKEKISHVINSKDHLGLTPLHYACSLGHVETVKTLLSLGADPTITNAAGQTPLFSCVRIPSLCEETLITNKTAIGLILIDQMTISDLALVDDSGNTALHEVVVHNLPSLVAKLIEKNPQLAFIANNFQRYPIHLAILNSQKENVAILLAVAGVEQLSDEKGRTALHYSAFYGGMGMLQLCCTYCKDLNIRDKENKTPLMQAAFAGRSALVELLLRMRADASLKSSSNMTALDYAIKNKHQSIVTILEKEFKSPELSKTGISQTK